MSYEELMTNLPYEKAVEVFIVLRWLNGLRQNILTSNTGSYDASKDLNEFHDVFLKIVESKDQTIQDYLNFHLSYYYEEMEEKILSYYKTVTLPEDLEAEVRAAK
jgi:hypothetical protein